MFTEVPFCSTQFYGKYCNFIFVCFIFIRFEINNITGLINNNMGRDTCIPLTSVYSDEPVQPLFKLRNSKLCSISSLTVIEYSSLIRLRVCAGWSETLMVAHTTLLEISCRGSICPGHGNSYRPHVQPTKTLISLHCYKAYSSDYNNRIYFQSTVMGFP